VVGGIRNRWSLKEECPLKGARTTHILFTVRKLLRRASEKETVPGILGKTRKGSSQIFLFLFSMLRGVRCKKPMGGGGGGGEKNVVGRG